MESRGPSRTGMSWSNFWYLIAVTFIGGFLLWFITVGPIGQKIFPPGPVVSEPTRDPTASDPRSGDTTFSTAGPTPSSTESNSENVTSIVDQDPSVAPAEVPLQQPTLDNFRISLRSKDYGDQVGPGQFELSDQHGMVRVIYTWEAVMSDGTGNDSEECQILASVSGPQQVDSMRTNKCTFQRVSTIAARADNVQDYTVPGEYTVTVKDELSGATGTTSFTVR